MNSILFVELLKCVKKPSLFKKKKKMYIGIKDMNRAKSSDWTAKKIFLYE